MTLLEHQASVGNQNPMPTDRVDDASTVEDVAAETLTWFFLDTGAWASATGEAAGTLVWGKLEFDGVLNSNKATLGSYNNTSYSFDAATRFDTLVSVPENVFSELQSLSPTDQAAKMGEYLTTNGEYAVDHRRGQIWGLALDTVADDAVSYSYKAPVAGGGGPSTSVDVKKVGGTAVPTAGGDAQNNTRATLPTRSRMMGFNGTTWDRIRAGVKTCTATLTGWLNTLPWAVYNATPTTRTDGQGGTLQAHSNGSLLVRDDAYDTSSASNKTTEQAPIYTNNIGDTLAELTNIATNTTGYLYLDMEGYKYFALQCETSGTAPTDTLTLTVEASYQDDGTAQASCTYQDVTSAWFGVVSVVDADTIFDKDTPCTAKYVRLKYVTSNDAGADADLTVYARRSY